MARHQRSNKAISPAMISKCEIAIVVAFALMQLIMAILHEPWHDESQAWMIARVSSPWPALLPCISTMMSIDQLVGAKQPVNMDGSLLNKLGMIVDPFIAPLPGNPVRNSNIVTVLLLGSMLATMVLLYIFVSTIIFIYALGGILWLAFMDLTVYPMNSMQEIGTWAALFLLIIPIDDMGSQYATLNALPYLQHQQTMWSIATEGPLYYADGAFQSHWNTVSNNNRELPDYTDSFIQQHFANKKDIVIVACTGADNTKLLRLYDQYGKYNRVASVSQSTVNESLREGAKGTACSLYAYN